MQELLYAVVVSGSNVSSPVALKQAYSLDVWVPTVTSAAALRMQGAFSPVNPTSANFRFIEPLPPNTGTFPIGAGDKFVALGAVGVALPPHIRAHFDVAQADTRTLVFVAKL